MDEFRKEIELVVLSVHRRNGGKLTELDWEWRLLHPALHIDSLDLAEIVAAIEGRFHISLFDLPTPPVIWGDVVRAVADAHRHDAS